MSLPPSVAIVILNWNGKHFLERFLPSVIASTYQNHFIVIADNGSSDDSISFMKEHYPALSLLQSDINEGFARGYNVALKQVKADYFILLNSDVEVQPGWIEPIINLMEGDKTIAACQPKILSYHDKTKFEYAGASGGWLDSFGYPFNRGRIFDICETDNGQYNKAEAIFWATGAAFFVRAPVYELMNGFDEFFFAHQEEIDLCWRIQLAGYKIFVEPSSVVFHVGGGTLPMGNKKKVFLNFRNNLVMLTKNLPAGQAIWKIPFRIGLDAIAAWKGLLTGSTVTFAAIVKAHFHYWRWLFFSGNKSKVVQRKNKEIKGVYRGLVIWDYFIKGRKTFSEILFNKK